MHTTPAERPMDDAESNATLMNVRVLDRLCELAALQVNISRQQVQPDSAFVQDLGFDSLDVAEYIMLIEEEFEVRIEDQDAEGAATPRMVADLITRRRSGSPG